MGKESVDAAVLECVRMTDRDPITLHSLLFVRTASAATFSQTQGFVDVPEIATKSEVAAA